MILGLSIETFTLLHVVLSLIGIATGIVVLIAMASGRYPAGLTGVFLLTTLLTTLTGFFFPTGGLTPAQIVGYISLAILIVALLALYIFKLTGPWRWLYVVTAVAALFLNIFVAIVQAFQKIELLQPLAPTQSEPPFLAAQVVALVLCTLLAVRALRRFHP